ncbi:glycosyltransferase family 2 protein [Hazenella sp. IB182357]|uniref:Glycosyltransferase family 2 protein n=1 Tax=Polycladospora coralii TaxID=2771432 RepID=A0A926NCN8_9BACL|nr:glycosyltransferase family A protein [Polycladospora coralii]MBD1371154.1 glycosyltransferase family 2 protein [Polycladospora coralii]
MHPANQQVGVSIICPTNKKHTLTNILGNYNRQSYPHKELIIVINSDQIEKELWSHETAQHKNIRIFRLPEHISLGACLNFAIEKRRYPYIARFDDDDYYGDRYLQNSLDIVFQYDADVVAREDFYMYISDQQALHTKHVGVYCIGGTLMFHERVLQALKFPEISEAEDVKFYQSCYKYDFIVKKPYHFKDFVYIRNSENKFHTWKPSLGSLYHDTHFVAHTDNFLSYLDA